MTSIVFRNAMVIDGTGAPPSPADVEVNGNRIASLAAANSIAAREDVQLIECDGATLMPGLIESHAHLSFVDTTTLLMLARQVAKHNVTINNLLPGPFETARTVDGLRKRSAKLGQDYETFAAARRAEVPAGRFGTADEFGRACAFLCSADAGFIVGQNLLIDGGAVNSTL